MKKNDDDLELLIKRYIRKSLSFFKPRDPDFTLVYLKKIMKGNTNCAYKSVMDNFHDRYRLGQNIYEPLYDIEYYQSLPVDNFPMLFKEDESEIKTDKSLYKKTSVKKLKNESITNDSENYGEFETRKYYILLEENIPTVRELLLSKIKKYIAIMEYYAWISKNGLTPPQIESITKSTGTNNGKYDLVVINRIINECFKDFIEDKHIEKSDYLLLVNLLSNFFSTGNFTTLPSPIKVNNRKTILLASILGKIYLKLKTGGISYVYLNLGKSNINLFNKYEITEEKYLGSTLYKYYNLKY